MTRAPLIDDRTLVFGKYKGRTPKSLLDTDPDYICWLYENVSPAIVSKGLYNDAQWAMYEDDVGDGWPDTDECDRS